MWGFKEGHALLERRDTDIASALQTSNNCSTEIRVIRGSSPVPLPIEKVPELWAENSGREFMSTRICETIFADAIDKHFGSREVLLQHCADELWQDLSRLNDIQRQAQQLGILGTFLGLAFSMPALMVVTQHDGSSGAMQQLFDSLGLAFSTSVTGLLTAIMLGTLVALIARRQTALLDVLYTLANNMLIVVRNAQNKSHIGRTLEALCDKLDDTERQLDIQAVAMKENANVLRLTIATATEVGRIGQSFVSAMDDLRQRLVKEMGNMANVLSKTIGAHAEDRKRAVDQVEQAYLSLEGRTASLFDLLKDQLEVSLGDAHRQATMAHDEAASVRTEILKIRNEIVQLLGENINYLRAISSSSADSRDAIVNANAAHVQQALSGATKEVGRVILLEMGRLRALLGELQKAHGRGLTRRRRWQFWRREAPGNGTRVR
jgi:hypothetical protein